VPLAHVARDELAVDQRRALRDEKRGHETGQSVHQRLDGLLLPEARAVLGLDLQRAELRGVGGVHRVSPVQEIALQLQVRQRHEHRLGHGLVRVAEHALLEHQTRSEPRRRVVLLPSAVSGFERVPKSLGRLFVFLPGRLLSSFQVLQDVADELGVRERDVRAARAVPSRVSVGGALVGGVGEQTEGGVFAEPDGPRHRRRRVGDGGERVERKLLERFIQEVHVRGEPSVRAQRLEVLRRQRVSSLANLGCLLVRGGGVGDESNKRGGRLFVRLRRVGGCRRHRRGVALREVLAHERRERLRGRDRRADAVHDIPGAVGEGGVVLAAVAEGAAPSERERR
jgi:hypothetical protein